jgi:cobyric acid synthase
MLGVYISDENNIEMNNGGVRLSGLGLLKIETSYATEKTRLPLTGVHEVSGQQIQGYEIHHGQSSSLSSQDECLKGIKNFISNRSDLGAISADGLVWGTYVHGVFDSDGFRNWFLNEIRIQKELSTQEINVYDIDKQIDSLAKVVRTNINMHAIYDKILLKGPSKPRSA